MVTPAGRSSVQAGEPAPVEHWFVYYKLSLDDLAPGREAARRLIECVGASTGVLGRVMMRVDTAGGQGHATLMELYPRIRDPAAFGRALESALATCGVPVATRAARRVERFIEA
jgi:hypothetical protein